MNIWTLKQAEKAVIQRRAEIIRQHYGGWDKIIKHHSYYSDEGVRIVKIDKALQRKLDNDPLCDMPQTNPITWIFGSFSYIGRNNG